MIQITLIQIDNYGPWTVTPTPRTESDLQTLQAELYADVQRQFAAKNGLVFFNRFDNLIAISNGLNENDHLQIQRSIRNRYPFTISMGVGTADNAYEAQVKASEALQNAGGAQSEERKEILAVDSLVSAEDSFVQIAHIDINGITETLTDKIPAYDTSVIVTCTQYHLMTELRDHDALLFFIGGDNYMSPCNGVSKEELEEVIVKIKEHTNVALKAGVGQGNTAEIAGDFADLALEDIRAGTTDSSVLILNGK